MVSVRGRQVHNLSLRALRSANPLHPEDCRDSDVRSEAVLGGPEPQNQIIFLFRLPATPDNPKE